MRWIAPGDGNANANAADAGANAAFNTTIIAGHPVDMIALLQRVTEASVRVDGAVVGSIGPGLLVLAGVRRDDDESSAERLIQRVLGYRVFADAGGRMNLSLAQTGGGLLLVPQFTLAADTRNGTRAGFSTAAAPDAALRLFQYLLGRARSLHSPVAAGAFGAHMQVALVNDGPVTFWLESGGQGGLE